MRLEMRSWVLLLVCCAWQIHTGCAQNPDSLAGSGAASKQSSQFEDSACFTSKPTLSNGEWDDCGGFAAAGGTVCTGQCKPGFTPVGGQAPTTRCRYGIWGIINGGCQPAGCTSGPPALEGGTWTTAAGGSCLNVPSSTTCIARCAASLVPTEDFITSTCTASSWSQPIGGCATASCPLTTLNVVPDLNNQNNDFSLEMSGSGQISVHFTWSKPPSVLLANLNPPHADPYTSSGAEDTTTICADTDITVVSNSTNSSTGYTDITWKVTCSHNSFGSSSTDKIRLTLTGTLAQNCSGTVYTEQVESLSYFAVSLTIGFGGFAQSAGVTPGRNLLSTERQQFSIKPPLSVDGDRPLVVAPLSIVNTSWEGHSTSDVAACFSGALITIRDAYISLSPGASQEMLQIYDLASDLAADMLSIFSKGGTMYMSPMRFSSRRLSARMLKSDLSSNYDSLAKMPSCIHVPSYLLHMVHDNIHAFGDIAAAPETLAEVTATVVDVVQERYPEQCSGIQGSTVTVRAMATMHDRMFAGNGDETGMWVFLATGSTGCAS